jgi:hypothetical protein
MKGRAEHQSKSGCGIIVVEACDGFNAASFKGFAQKAETEIC